MKEIGFEIWRKVKGVFADVLWAVGKVIMFPADVVMLVGDVLCVGAEAIRGSITEETDPMKLMDEIIDA